MSLSPGLAHSCFELLEIINRHKLSFDDIRRAFEKIGVTPTDYSLTYAQEMGWILLDETGIAIASNSGKKLLSLVGTKQKLQQSILDFINVKHPFWLQNAAFGRKKLLLYVHSEIYQVFLEAGLVGSINEDIVKFWDILASRARGLQNDSLLSIGRQGERLTLNYEKARTGYQPKWVSIESNEDGYDVLSVINNNDKAKLSIEVKTTKNGIDTLFYLTRNEWERAVDTESHCFHLWDLSNDIPKLAVLTMKDIENHISIDKGKGEWQHLAIPFSIFVEKFTNIITC
ncbi:DUF3883 domain-containing protein [Rickettsia endosymbiont of Polydrusus tereticollis]|uniref:DUF3883 domain-containing protein n=1 Tax=Rickettsia endosymbiont of Polydrusus tereticollis TaxID=3066251 RepID=UPI003133030C